MARLAVLGNSGTGKSWAAGALLERVLDPDHPSNPGETFDLAVHFDFENEERGLSERGEYSPLLWNVPVDRETANRFNWRAVLDNHKKIQIVPDMEPDAMCLLLGHVCNCMMDLCTPGGRGDRELTGILSVDEAHNLIPQTINDRRIHRLISGGRKHGVEFVVISQRPASLHTNALGLADKRFYFRVDEKNDLRGLRDVTTFDANNLQRLDDREVIVENKSTGTHRKESTNNWTRFRKHYARDDGILDAAINDPD